MVLRDVGCLGTRERGMLSRLSCASKRRRSRQGSGHGHPVGCSVTKEWADAHLTWCPWAEWTEWGDCGVPGVPGIPVPPARVPMPTHPPTFSIPERLMCTLTGDPHVTPFLGANFDIHHGYALWPCVRAISGKL
jgi:hypothetical protein